VHDPFAVAACVSARQWPCKAPPSQGLEQPSACHPTAR